MTVALIRHGQTAGNLRGAYIGGTTDEPLCDAGIRQLTQCVPPSAEMVISSPMARCVQTCGLLFPTLEPVVVDDLRERSFGAFEGLCHKEITALPGHRDWGMEEKSMVFPGGEERTPFLRRSRRGFDQALRLLRASGCPRAAVVTHGGVIMAALSGLVADKPLYHWQVPCAGGWLLDWDGAGALSVRPLTMQ